jgi:thiosulfate/3-mercaptopyruvate sulfurtransferase
MLIIFSLSASFASNDSQLSSLSKPFSDPVPGMSCFALGSELSLPLKRSTTRLESEMRVGRIAACAAIGLALATAVAQTAFADPAKEPLVTAECLEKKLENPKVRIVEVSVDPGVYERGHITGAVNWSWHTDLVDKSKRDIASRENFEKILQTAGIDRDSTIVIYGDNNNWFAAWGAWVLNVYGLGDQVRLLDGGRKYWEKKALPLSTTTETPKVPSIKLSERDPA